VRRYIIIFFMPSYNEKTETELYNQAFQDSLLK